MINNKQPHTYKRVRSVLSATTLSLLVLGFGQAPIVNAVDYQAQISALQSQNSTNQNAEQTLMLQASGYQNAINTLQNQIASLQGALQINQNKQVSLQQQISQSQLEIVQKKSVLSDDVKTMYVQGQMSTIEELATSNNLSAYVDKEEYRLSVSKDLSSIIKQITTLENQLQQQKVQLDTVVKTEQMQNSQLVSAQAQQQQLLGYNQSQQDSYNQQIQSNQAQIGVLQAEQIAANRALVSSHGGRVISSGSCGGGYPKVALNSYGGHWGCDYPLDHALDNWGMYNQECVSYTAWMVYKTYGYMPDWGAGGNGDANQWPANAQAAGIATGSTPKVGSVAIYMGGAGDPWGHAMWVKSINGNMITVDQYNLYFSGGFYETTIDGSGLTYIYFGG